MQPGAGRLADEASNAVSPRVLHPAQLEAGGRQDDGCVRMGLPDVLDQDAGTLRIAARPDVVNEDVGTLSKATGPTRKDRADTPRRPAALGDVVSEATKGVRFLPTQIQIMVDDEGASHVTPLRECAFARSWRAG
jgi:hypothetical protein